MEDTTPYLLQVVNHVRGIRGKKIEVKRRGGGSGKESEGDRWREEELVY